MTEVLDRVRAIIAVPALVAFAISVIGASLVAATDGPVGAYPIVVIIAMAVGIWIVVLRDDERGAEVPEAPAPEDSVG